MVLPQWSGEALGWDISQKAKDMREEGKEPCLWPLWLEGSCCSSFGAWSGGLGL